MKRVSNVGPIDIRNKVSAQGRERNGDSASSAIAGPRSDPPIPILTTYGHRLAESAAHSALANVGSESQHLLALGDNVGRTSRPSTKRLRAVKSRRAVCSAARRSVELTISPRNMASRLRSTPAAVARETN